MKRKLLRYWKKTGKSINPSSPHTIVDGVNIAARVQAAAAPGCIFISDAVHRNISNKTDIETRFSKEAILKNVSQPIRMY